MDVTLRRKASARQSQDDAEESLRLENAIPIDLETRSLQLTP
jgi:hypothetical protein